jgi:hypothetical protein
MKKNGNERWKMKSQRKTKKLKGFLNEGGDNSKTTPQLDGFLMDYVKLCVPSSLFEQKWNVRKQLLYMTPFVYISCLF